MIRRPSLALLLAVLAAFTLPIRAQEPAPAEAPAPEPIVVTDPVVRALLDTNPDTPEKVVRVINILLDLDQPQLARRMLEQLATSLTDDAALEALAGKLGTAPFERWAAQPELGPTAVELAARLDAAAAKRARDPATLAAALERLSTAGREGQLAAIDELRVGGETSAAALIAALVDPARAAVRPRLRAALAALGADAVGPIGAALASGPPELRAELVQALALMGERDLALDLLPAALDPKTPAALRPIAERSLARLWGKPLSPAAGAAYLLDAARRTYHAPAADAPSGEALAWTWDAMAAQLTSAPVPRRVRDLARAQAWAEAARAIDPRLLDADLVAWGLRIERDLAALEPGAELPSGDGTLRAELAAADVRLLGRLLTASLADGHDEVARVVATAIGEMKNPASADPLAIDAPYIAPLVAAARHPNARVRLAALASMLKVQPGVSYPGMDAVTEQLGYFATGRGLRGAVVAHPRIDVAARWAGYLRELGYAVEVVTGPREVAAAAIATADLELIVLAGRLCWPAAGELVSELRQDVRTARVPIVVLVDPEDLAPAEALARAYPRVIAAIDPVDARGFSVQTAGGLAEWNDLPTADERRAAAQQALGWLADAKATPERVYDLRRVEPAVLAALAWADTAPAAARAAARLGSPAAQRALVDWASQNALPIERRQAAAEAFRASVAEWGLLLTTTEILRQYERYNASERLDAQTQALLGGLLDVIERREAEPAASAAVGP